MLKNTLNTGTLLIADLCRNALYIIYCNIIYEFTQKNYSILNSVIALVASLYNYILAF